MRSLLEESGLSFQVASRRTYSCYLKKLGHYYFSAQRKGILSDNDKKVRLQFARNMKQEMIRNPAFWKNEISFYLDGALFIHKYNAKSGAASNRASVWQKREQGLRFTAKGCKDLASGRRLHVFVAIAYGKGVILKVPYKKKTGEFFCDIYLRTFQPYFCKRWSKSRWSTLICYGQRPLTDQLCCETRLAEIEGSFHEIPPRSPDLNPIENIFHLVKRYLDQEAISRNITR